MRQTYRTLIVFGFCLLITPFVVFGQNIEALCRVFANEAFRDIGNNCANLDLESGCYGFGNFGEITTTFYIDGEAQVIQEDIFDEPSERISLLNQEELTTLESIETEEFFLDQDNDDEDEDRWGVAILEVVANLPSQLEQNTAVYIIFGGTRLENSVYPEDAFVLPEQPVIVTVADGTSVYGSPEGLGYKVPDQIVGTVSGELEADAISPDGNWLRVFVPYERQLGVRATAWVRISDLVDEVDVDSLPVLGPDTYTAMQNFYLLNELTTPICDEIPQPGLLVQGPGEIETDFVIDNMPVRVTSTAYFRQIAPQRLHVTTLSGFTVLFPDTANEEIIPEGFSRVVCLTEMRDLGIDEQENDRELEIDCDEEGLAIDIGYAGFANIPGNILNYGFSLPRQICPSGVGNPGCRVIPNSNSRIPQKCEAGQLPAAVCERFGS